MGPLCPTDPLEGPLVRARCILASSLAPCSVGPTVTASRGFRCSPEGPGMLIPSLDSGSPHTPRRWAHTTHHLCLHTPAKYPTVLHGCGAFSIFRLSPAPSSPSQLGRLLEPQDKFLLDVNGSGISTPSQRIDNVTRTLTAPPLDLVPIIEVRRLDPPTVRVDWGGLDVVRDAR
ncbi:uncharacterized protein N7482_009135 [Penicillium canariense]|uniref:Uncharacterized protein n=1 Tax=Penicillium canariense TaxID=189055 RepID=A0A9W9HNI2_9EURO|nr:uncharacterized protein N7482_009135 [Penicillium canariense]KAJ5152657.1 hypothetical protein N7482_009135 [Penicillium canariense]